VVPRGRRMLTPYVSRLGPQAGRPGAIRPRRRGRFEPPAPAPIDGLILAPGLDEQASDPPLVPEALEVFTEIETGAGVAPDRDDVRRPDAPLESHGRLGPGAGPEPTEPGRTVPGPTGPERRPQDRAEPGPETRMDPAAEIRAEPGPEIRMDPSTEIRAEPGPETRTEPGPENRSEPTGIEPVPAPQPPTRERPAASPGPPAPPRRPTPSGARGPREAAARSRPSGVAPTIEPAIEPAITEPAITEPAIAEPAIGEPAIGEPAIAEPAIAEPAIVVSATASAASPAPVPGRESRAHRTAADAPAGTRPPMRSAPSTSAPPDEHADDAGHSRKTIVRASRSDALGLAASHGREPRHEGEPATRRSAGTPPEPMWAARPAPPPPPTVGHSPSQGAGRSYPAGVPNTDVTVTIGRVEVRVPPAPPVRQRPSRPRRQPPSLEQYLEARAKGLAG
jgi:hypothetical protein